MSGTFPSSPYFNAVNFKINTPTLKTETISGKSRRVGMGHSYYSFSVKYSPLSRYEAGPILGFVSEQYGSLESFQIVLPDLSYSKQTNQTSASITVGTSVLAGVDQVSISGLTGGKNLLRAGDFFKFSNHSKVYMCARSCVSGDTTLYFSGSLVKDVPSGTSIVYNAVPFTVILETDVQQYDVGLGGMTNISLDMKETW